MKAIDIVRSTQLPVPRDEVDDLVSRHGRRLIPRLTDLDTHLKGIDCSADGKRLVGFGDKWILLWNTEESEPCARVQLRGRITCAAISDSGATAIAGTASGDVFVLKLPELAVLSHRKESSPVFDVHLASSGVGVFCDVEGRIAAYDYTTDENLPPVSGTGNPAQVWISDNGEALLVDDEKQVILCHPKDEWIENRYSYAQAPGGSSTPGVLVGGWLVSKKRRGIYIWNRKSTTIAAVLDHPSEVAAFDMTSDMGTIVTITNDETIHQHSPRHVEEHKRHVSAPTYVRQPHSIKIRGDRIFVAGKERSMLAVTRNNVPARSYYDRLIPIVSAAVSADSRWITIGDQAGGITIYDAKEGMPVLGRLDSPESGSTSAIDTDFANKIVVAGGRNGQLRVISYGDAPTTNQFDFGGAVQAVRLVGEQAFLGNTQGALARTDIRTGRIVQSYEGHKGRIRRIEVYQDKLLSIDHFGAVCVFDVETARLLFRFFVKTEAYAACFDHVRQHIYAGGADGAAHCWDLDSGRKLARFPLNRSAPRSLTASGDQLVSTGLRGDVRIFDLAAQELTLAIQVESRAWLRWGCTNVSATRIMTGGADGIMRFFCASTGAELAQGMHLPRGYLWVGGDLSAGDPEWFWTDRTDLLDAVAQQADNVDVLAADSEERRTFLMERNSARTMAMVGFYPGLEERKTLCSGAQTAATPRLQGPKG